VGKGLIQGVDGRFEFDTSLSYPNLVWFQSIRGVWQYLIMKINKRVDIPLFLINAKTFLTRNSFSKMRPTIVFYA
jgi:hypothetical protein